MEILLPGVVVFVFTKFQLDLSTFTSSDLTFISSKFQTLFFPYKLSYYATGGPYYTWATRGLTSYF